MSRNVVFYSNTIRALTALLLSTLLSGALAQGYPAKPIRMLIGFSAGSTNDVLARILQLPDVKERLLALGAEPAPTTPAEFDAHVRAEVAKFRKIVQDAGIKPE